MNYQERFIRPQQAISRLTELGYGKKTVNRLVTALDQSSLLLLDNKESRKIAGGDLHLISKELGEFPLKKVDVAAIGEFNSRIIAATEALLLVNLDQKKETAKGKKTTLERESYIEGIGAQDIHNILNIASELALTSDQPSHVIRTVFGGTGTMPARSLGYMTPGLILLEDLQRRKVPLPQLQFVFAHRISAEANNLNPAMADKQASLLAKTGKVFVENFFPNISDRVVFMETLGISNCKQSTEVADELKQIYQTEIPSELKLKMNSKGENNGGASNSDTYAVAHFLVHDRYTPGFLTPMFEDQTPEVLPSSIISIGGMQEKDFYNVRMMLKQAAPNLANVNTLFLQTRHGVPPYLMANNGKRDLSLADYLRDGEYPYQGGLGSRDRLDSKSLFDPSALLDYKNLALVMQNRGGLETFMAKFRRMI